jgi:hypothetical protein
VNISPSGGKFIVVPKDKPIIVKRDVKRILGNPQEYDTDTQIRLETTPIAIPQDHSEPKRGSMVYKPNVNPYEDDFAQSPASAQAAKNLNRKLVPAGSSAAMGELYTPIKALTTFIYDWKVKARVLKKFAPKEWTKANNSGKLQNLELVD